MATLWWSSPRSSRSTSTIWTPDPTLMRITTLVHSKATGIKMVWWAKWTIHLPLGLSLPLHSLLEKKRILMSWNFYNLSSWSTCRNLHLEEPPVISLSISLIYTSNWTKSIKRKEELIRHSRINNNSKIVEETTIMILAQSIISRKLSCRMHTRVSDSKASPRPSRFRTL